MASTVDFAIDVDQGAALTDGELRQTDELQLWSEMNAGGVVFGDGLEADRLACDWGVRLTVGVVARTLELVGG